MVDRLSGQLTDVGDNAVTIGKALLFGKPGNDGEDVADHSLVLLRHLGGRRKMPLWYDEEMRGRKG